MANFVSNTSDKSQKKAKTLVLIGGLGLNYFYVGKIKIGILRFILGILLWVLLIAGIAEGETAMIVAGAAFLVVINLYDIIKLSLGRFQDNVGAYLRQ